jgi:bifunctional NMN adenylyltransferase/nudix hydrolase
MKFKTGVIIGRFQPFHSGHAKLLNEALRNSEKVVVILGSANSARSVRNPLLASERKEMIRANLSSTDLARVSFGEVRDYFYNNSAWTNEVLEKVRSGAPAGGSTALFGYEKDFSSHYLKWFPDWKYAGVEFHENLSATPLRERFLRDIQHLASESALSEATKTFLRDFARSNPAYTLLCEEQKMIDRYKAEWAGSPYQPVFVTTDAIVVQAAHILLVKRKHSPGKGLWAIPGGFLDPHELLINCAIRELFEETQIQVPAEVLHASLVQAKPFDHPLRSARGRTITHGHYFRLPGDRLPEIHASDDAAEAIWVPILDLAKMEDQFFEDHFHIIQTFIRNY